MAAAIHRVGKIYIDPHTGLTVLDGWHIAPGVDDPEPLTSEWTDEDARAWIAHCVEQARRVTEGDIEPPDPDTEVIRGWTLRELAELSVTLGEGTTLAA